MAQNVEAVFIIDGTGTMHTMIDGIKEKINCFSRDFRERMRELGREVEDLKVKLAIFRDYKYDAVPMDITDWYETPVDDDLLEDRLKGIIPKGGGDQPENGLEALYLSMKSGFEGSPSDARLFFLITDADALPLGTRRGCPHYPADMGSFRDLTSLWENMSVGGDGGPRATYLWIFAPTGTQYESLVSSLPHCLYQPIVPEATSFPYDLAAIAGVLEA